ncbi:unnamed protein product [Peronospora destructor]|uniref:Uncharacterized protein n=1 Tax=Peronospora destructor TaxID=86335 RepID=A0AAV0SW48_9STRA|nr:unnamed protein product [Peronospora destructor]
MTEPSSAVEEVPAVGREVDNLPVIFSASDLSSRANKRSATEVFEGDSIEDLNDTETTLDDVLMPCRTKKSKLLDEELPDVDDNEEFPLQTEEMDENLALSLENGENDLHMDEEALLLATNSHKTREQDLNLATQKDAEELALSKEEDEKDEDEENSEEKSDFSTSINNEIDVVDVEDEEEEEAEGYEEQFSEEEEEETMRAIARAQNQKEARDLLLQLDDSTRSKLCLTAMEKYGEELFYGHEVARDAILVDACAQDSILSLMRDAIRVKDLYLRGSSAAAPLELDDDEDEGEEGEGEDEIGGYEDEEEDADDEEEQSTGSIEDNDDEVVIISEEEEGEKADVDASSSILCSSEKVRLMPQPHSAAETGCDIDPNDGYKGDHSEQGTMEGEALGNVGAAATQL